MSETPLEPNRGTDLTEAAEAELGPLASTVEATFAELSQSIVEELDRASVRGRQSVSDLVDGMLEDLARLAARELIGNPLHRALGGEKDDSGRFFRSLIRRTVRNG